MYVWKELGGCAPARNPCASKSFHAFRGLVRWHQRVLDGQ